MIKIMKTKFGRCKSQTSKDNDRVQPMPMPEDIFLRNETTRMLSITSSEDNSCHSTELFYANNTGLQTQGITRGITRVFIPNNIEPGQKVKIQYSDGIQVRTEIPPRTEWIFLNHGGEPRPFFVAPVPGPAAAAASPFTSRKPPPCIKIGQNEKKNRSSSEPRKKVQFMVCQCTPSLGVYDSICPYHGTGALNS